MDGGVERGALPIDPDELDQIDLLEMLRTANMAIFGANASGHIDVWNEAQARLTGLPTADALGRHLLDDIMGAFISDSTNEQVRQALVAALNGTGSEGSRAKITTLEGETRWLEVTLDPRVSKSGTSLGLTGAAVDVTELVTVHEENNRYACEFLDFIDTAKAPIVGVDALGRVNCWNGTMERLTGYTQAAVTGRNLISTFVDEANRRQAREAIDSALSGESVPSYELTLLKTSGQKLHLLMNATPRHGVGDVVIGVIGIGQDISERLEKEAIELHRVKLESIGSLTGGIAHDFNNLLTVISGNLSLLNTVDSHDSEVLEDARKAAADGAELVRSLLAFSRQQQLTPRSHEISYLLDNFQRSVVRTLSDEVTLHIQATDLPGRVFVDRTQFEAALLNLCINAADALDGPGDIQIDGSVLTADADVISSFAVQDSEIEQFFLIEVTDNGRGISPADLDKITEPFFTTKQDAGGTGLGLSSVKGFVEQSGGGLRITSQLGVGTCVQLLLPYTEASTSELQTDNFKQMSVGVAPGAGRRILVVDDEPGVRKLVSRWLSRQGYQVLEAESGDEALELLEELNGAVDVIFSDVVMPGSHDGFAVAALVSERWPHVGCLLATGYDQDRRFHAGGREKLRFPILSKPYDLNDLGAAISEQIRLVS